jgi:tryptophanase
MPMTLPKTLPKTAKEKACEMELVWLAIPHRVYAQIACGLRYML